MPRGKPGSGIEGALVTAQRIMEKQRKHIAVFKAEVVCEQAKNEMLLEWYSLIRDEYEIEMCNCGGIVDLKNPLQADSDMCEQCLDVSV